MRDRTKKFKIPSLMKQNPKSFTTLVQIIKKIHRSEYSASNLDDLSSEINQRFGLTVNCIKGTGAVVYTNVTHVQNSAFNINPFALAKGNKAAVTATRKLSGEFSSKATVNYKTAKFNKITKRNSFNMYINVTKLKALNVKAATKLVIAAIGTAWFITDTKLRLGKILKIVHKVGKGYSGNGKREAKLLSKLGVFKTGKEAKVFMDTCVRGNYPSACGGILRKTKTNIINKIHSGNTFLSIVGGNKTASLEKRKPSAGDILLAFLAYYYGITFMMLGVYMIASVVFILPGLIFLFIGIALVRVGNKQLETKKRKKHKKDRGYDRSDTVARNTQSNITKGKRWLKLPSMVSFIGGLKGSFSSRESFDDYVSLHGTNLEQEYNAQGA